MSHRSAPARSRCAITGEELPSHRLVAVDHLRPSLAARIRQDHPDLPDQAAISRREADRYRALYVEDLLRAERGELTELDAEVARSLAEGDFVSQNIEADYAEVSTFGEKLSDALAFYGGSWAFLIGFAAILGVWITLNAFRADRAFDPYPFILLLYFRSPDLGRPPGALSLTLESRHIALLRIGPDVQGEDRFSAGEAGRSPVLGGTLRWIEAARHDRPAFRFAFGKKSGSPLIS